MIANDFDFISWNILFAFIISFSIGCGIALRKRKRSSLMLDLNNESSETFCHAPLNVDLDSDSTMSRLVIDIGNEGGKQSGAILFL